MQLRALFSKLFRSSKTAPAKTTTVPVITTPAGDANANSNSV